MGHRARSTSRREFLRAAGAFAGGVAILGPAACSESSGGGGGGAYSGEIAISHLTAVVGSAPIHIAAGKNFFADADLDLNPVSFPGGSDTVRGILSGMNMGEPATVSTLIAYHKGQRNLRLIGGAFNGTQVLFMVPVDSPIQSVDDMEGRTIAVSTPGSISNYFADRVAREVGLTPGENVEIVNVGGPPDAWTAASEGVTDIAWSAPPLASELIESGEARVVFHTKDYAQSWVDQMLVSTEQFIESNEEAVQGFVTAIGQACDFIRENTGEAAEIYGRALEITPSVAEAALRDPGLDVWSSDFDMAGIEENVRAGVELGQIEEGFTADDMIVRDFV